ncbi:MAG: plastocyanin/azurin family copper-binding protein [Thermoplasmatales archaeon]|nr:plastocyanin/azurin family copper-binding protein [Thermoplasmatales archaeon]
MSDRHRIPSNRHRRAWVGAALIVIAVGITSLAAFGWYGFVVPAATQQSAPPPSSAGTSFTVTASAPFHFTESTDEVAANATITLTFTNTDTIAHTFSLFSVQGVAIPSTASVNFTGVSYGGHFYPFLFVLYQNGTGTHSAYTFQAPPTGWYEFVCSEPGHFAAGMFNAIGFGIPAPANITGGGAAATVGWPVFVIAGTIGGLVVLAVVLGFAWAPRDKRPEAPPEEPEYPEPSAAHSSGAPLPPTPPSRPPT